MCVITNVSAFNLVWDHYYQNARARRMEGRIVSGAGGQRFVLSQAELHRIPDSRTLENLGPGVEAIPASWAGTTREGAPFPHLETPVPWRTVTNEVFLLSAGCLHYIPDPTTLDVLGLPQQIRDVPDTVFQWLPRCEPLPHRELPVVTGSPNAPLVVYKGQRHPLPDARTLDILRLGPGQYSNSPVDVSLPVGLPLPPLKTKALRNRTTGEVFFVDSGCLHRVPDSQTLRSMNLQSQTADAPAPVFEALPKCAPVARVSISH